VILIFRRSLNAPLFPLVNSFVDPLFAHNGHVKQPEIIAYMLCGAKAGQLNVDGCRGLSSPDLQGKNLRRKLDANEQLAPLKGEAAVRAAK